MLVVGKTSVFLDSPLTFCYCKIIVIALSSFYIEKVCPFSSADRS